jgi:hypothetical protein
MFGDYLEIDLDMQSFEKIIRCNPKFLIDAVAYYRQNFDVSLRNIFF